MGLNLWSIILIASASQCIFLIFMFFSRASQNRSAKSVLLAILIVILLINVGNLWYAAYIYRSYPELAGISRGMLLLLGPLFYFYSQAILKPEFKLKWSLLIHFIPYFLVFLMFYGRGIPNSTANSQEMLDKFMEGRLPISNFSISRFIFYFLHLELYLFAILKTIRFSIKNDNQRYLIPSSTRVKWVKKIVATFGLLAIILVGITTGMIFTGFISAEGNFFLTIILSALVYMIAYQAIFDFNKVAPDFSTKYNSLSATNSDLKKVLDEVISLFEREKPYTDSDISLKQLASSLNISPHILSSAINQELNKTFFELLREYRIKEFIERANNPENSNLSIMGIAYGVGYNSKSSFNTAFKKEIGSTPSEYLKKLNQ